MQRVKWIDGVRGILILMVVLGHSIQTSGYSLDGTLLIRFIETLQMPMFMLVSGYVLYKASMPISGLRKKQTRLLVPFISWTLLFFVWKCVFHGMAWSSFGSYVSGVADRPDRSLWFLWVLAICISLVFGIRHIADVIRANELALNAVLAAGLIVFIAVTGFNKFAIQLVSWYYPFVLLGYYLHKFSGKVNQILTGRRAFVIASFFTACYFLLVHFWRWKSVIPLPFGISMAGIAAECYRMVVPFVGCVAWVSWCWQFPESRIITNPYIVRLGQMTLGIYAVHQAVLAEVQPYFSGGGWRVPIVFLISLVTSIFLVVLFRKNVFLSRILLGESSEHAK